MKAGKLYSPVKQPLAERALVLSTGLIAFRLQGLKRLLLRLSPLVARANIMKFPSSPPGVHCSGSCCNPDKEPTCRLITVISTSCLLYPALSRSLSLSFSLPFFHFITRETLFYSYYGAIFFTPLLSLARKRKRGNEQVSERERESAAGRHEGK